MIQTLCSRLVLSLLAFPLKLANARLVEGYIDDTFGDALTGFKPRYYPPIPGLWQNASCTDCIIKPDSSRTNNGSWTSGGYSPSKTGPLTIELEFSGVAFSVYFVLANIVPGAETKTKAHFILDGFEVETFQHQPVADSPTFQYDSLVFHAQDLEDRQHLLTIMAHDPEDEMWIAFDYVIYLNQDALISYDDGNSSDLEPTPVIANGTLPSNFTTGVVPASQPNLTTLTPPEPQNHKRPLGGIIGGTAAVATVVVLSALIWFFCLWIRHRPPKKLQQGSEALVGPKSSTSLESEIYPGVYAPSFPLLHGQHDRSKFPTSTYGPDQSQKYTLFASPTPFIANDPFAKFPVKPTPPRLPPNSNLRATRSAFRSATTRRTTRVEFEPMPIVLEGGSNTSLDAILTLPVITPVSPPTPTAHITQMFRDLSDGSSIQPHPLIVFPLPNY